MSKEKTMFGKTYVVKVLEDGECVTVGEAPRWIPVTERLPENPAQVLVTYSWGEVTVGEYWNNGEGWGTYGEEVLAWMPLPEPYKGGEEHETD